MLRTLRTALEFLAAFFGIVLLVLAFVIWRLNASPINSTFLTPYIESGIERLVPDGHVQFTHTLLTWDNVDHSVALHADGLVIKNGKGNVIAEVPMLDIRLSLFGILVGQFWPAELTVNHPQIKLNRHADGKLYFAALQAGSDSIETSEDSRDVLQKTMRNLTHAYAMRHLSVYRAVVDIHDEVSNRTWSISVPEISLVRTLTQLVGNAKIDLTQKEDISSLELHYAYDHIKSLHRVSTRFKDITPAQLVGGHPETLGLDVATMLNMSLSGEIEIAFDPQLDISAAATTVHGGKGVFVAPTLWDKPRSVNGFDIEADYDKKLHKLNVVTAAFDFDGARLNLTANGHVPEDTQKYDLDFSMHALMENWPMDTFGDLWPKPIIANARDWMVPNITKGVYDKGEGVFTGSLAWRDLANLVVTSGKGKITATHGTVAYIHGMPPVVGVRADADFDLNQMSLTLSDGSIGNLKMQPFTAKITGLSDTNQFIDIPLKLSGPIADVVALINHPPLGYAKAVGLPVDALSGSAEGTVNLHFPLIKELDAKDIDVTGTAQLTNVASAKLIKGVDVTDGHLSLDLDKDGFAVKGPLQISKIPFQFDLHQYFHELSSRPLRQVSIAGVINDEQWKTLGDDFAGSHGAAAVNLQITQPNKLKTILTGSADLTAAEFHAHPLNWKKPAGVPATMQFNGEIVDGKDMAIKTITLRGPQARADGRAIISPSGVLKSLNLEPLVIGRTVANIGYSLPDGEGGAMHIDVHGQSLDIGGLKSSKSTTKGDQPAVEYHLNVGKLFIGDSALITNAEGYAIRDTKGWSAISLHGLADGAHKLDMDLTPQADGTRTFLVTCDDFGKMLKGLGITDTVKEGNVRIEGHSQPATPREINGTMDVGAFTVGKLPAMMLLLNATSPFGFSGLVTDSASYDHMRGSFTWSGDEIELLHVNAAGTSTGMNINGKVDVNTGMANLHGTLVPFSTVNHILSYIPVLGYILTGGSDGGVLAVSYSIKGALANPKVSVNPVSLLTPGFLRNLFFGENNDEEVPEPEAAKP